MILSGKTIIEMPRWLRGLVILAAAVVVPLGFTLAQDDGDELESVRQWLESGVNSAFVTQEQADIMLRALEASERGLITLSGGDGNFIINRRFVTGEPGEADVDAVRVEVLAETRTVSALEFAARYFAGQAEAGLISAEEADAIMTDLNLAFELGLTEGSEFYAQQLENGAIDQATVERRLQMIEGMEQAWNATGNVNVRLDGLSTGRRIVHVEAVPVVTNIEVVREEAAE